MTTQLYIIAYTPSGDVRSVIGPFASREEAMSTARYIDLGFGAYPGKTVVPLEAPPTLTVRRVTYVVYDNGEDQDWFDLPTPQARRNQALHFASDKAYGDVWIADYDVAFDATTGEVHDNWTLWHSEPHNIVWFARRTVFTEGVPDDRFDESGALLNP